MEERTIEEETVVVIKEERDEEEEESDEEDKDEESANDQIYSGGNKKKEPWGNYNHKDPLYKYIASYKGWSKEVVCGKQRSCQEVEKRKQKVYYSIEQLPDTPEYYEKFESE